MNEHTASLAQDPAHEGLLACCTCGWADPNGFLPWPAAEQARLQHYRDAVDSTGPAIIELTAAQATQLAAHLTDPRGSRIRVMIDGGVKVDVGYGWTPPYGWPQP